MKPHLKTILLLVGTYLISAGFTQTAPYVLTTFDLTQLDARPGKLLVSPDVLTLLEFDDQVADVSTARPDAMTIEVSGNVIRLRSNWRAGSTDLVVTVANQTAMFTVEIEPEGGYTRRYVVTKPKPPTPAISSATRSSTSQISALEESLEESTSALPDWLSASFNVLSVPGRELVIQYGLKNAGENDLANDAMRLRLVQEGRSVPFRLERLNTGGTVNRIKPGYAEYGTILVEDPLPGKLTLVWELIEIGPGYTYTLRKDVQDGLVQQVR